MMLQLVALDVWGNKKDGYEINAWQDTGNFFSLPDNTKNADILVMLKKAGILKPRYKFTIEDCGTVWFINNLGRPVIQLKWLTRNDTKYQTAERWAFDYAMHFENARIYGLDGKLKGGMK